MTPKAPKHKLAAIMFTDMVGYTSMMQKDEDEARKLIERHRAHMQPFVEKYGGEIIQFVGDGTFCRFDSAIEAVKSALEIQKVLEMEPEINLRIGIHVGDVVVKGDEVYGDGVNVASRLEPLAESGGVCISGRVYDDIRNQPDMNAEFLGEKSLKNVGQSIKVYALKGDDLSLPQKEIKAEHKIQGNKKMQGWLAASALLIVALLLGGYFFFSGDMTSSPDKKMLVVLPFENLGSPENEYFADGITDEITSRLAAISGLGVISRTSAIQFKNVAISAAEIGKQLGVQYILEGTIRFQPTDEGINRVRITPQLIRVSDDTHLWATTYDEFMVEIFDLQTKIAEKVASALDITLLEPERELLNRKHTNNLEAYDYFLRGNDYLNRGTEERNFAEAIDWYKKAVKLDPNFALAYARLSLAYTNLYWHGGFAEEDKAEAEKAVFEAFRLKPNLPEAHLALGEFQNRVHRDYDEALEHFTIALKSQPNNSEVYAAMALVHKRRGNWDNAIDYFNKAMKLDPLSPIKAIEAGHTYLYMREYSNAEKSIARAITLNPSSFDNYTYEAWLYLLWDKKERAQKVIDEATEVDRNKVMAGVKSYLFGKGLWSFDLLYAKDMEASDALSMDSFGEDRLTYYISKAQLYTLEDDIESKQAYYDSALVILERQVKSNPKSPMLQSLLGFVSANLGFRDRAIEAGRKAMEIMPISTCHY
ncbi:MAG: tetratricopeptide repeat protein [Candidatus Marinimicrobia bacterium]|nr:tetratricopeptide repeat protein [Candidatus Neomarinimicrobiota bacterium]